MAYDLPCPIARTLDIVGERWTLLILRDLLRFGTRRYQDLLDGLPGLGPGMLSDRLKTLEASGIVERHFYTQHPPRAAYRLTGRGQTLGPVLAALRDWGLAHTEGPVEGPTGLLTTDPPRG